MSTETRQRETPEGLSREMHIRKAQQQEMLWPVKGFFRERERMLEKEKHTDKEMYIGETERENIRTGIRKRSRRESRKTAEKDTLKKTKSIRERLGFLECKSNWTQHTVVHQYLNLICSKHGIES